jgi:hypothetical protein
MRCYFLRDGHLAGVEMLPPGFSDEDAIARAHILSSKRKGPLDGFEVWERGRAIVRHPDPYAETLASRLLCALDAPGALMSSSSRLAG